MRITHGIFGVAATCITVVLLTVLVPVTPVHASESEIFFPVEAGPEMVLHDNYGDSRGGRTHRGVDIMAPQMTPVYAAAAGYIRRAYGGDSQRCLSGRCSSYGLLVHGDDGNSYFYLHLNDDTPGRPSSCDHRGGAENAFAPRLVDVIRHRGTLEPLPNTWRPRDVVRVEQGELLGYVGSSGNAGCGTDHLHFEMWQGHEFYGADDSRKSDPYPRLRAALDHGRVFHPPAPHARVAGGDRVETSTRLSREAFSSAEAVVLAPAGVPTEALLAAPLGAVVAGPVLLAWDEQSSDRDVLDPAVADEITRLGARQAIIVGSTERLDGALEEQLIERTPIDPDRIERIEAPDRYALSHAVAERVFAAHGLDPGGESGGGGSSDEAFNQRTSSSGDGGESRTVAPLLALGEHEDPSRSWPDALSSTVIAARQGAPIVLTRGNELPAPTREVLSWDGIDEVRVVGGTAAISTGVEEAVEELGHTTRRLHGRTRYETALAVADETMRDGATARRVMAATGHDFPDALAAGPSVAALGAVMVLTDGRHYMAVDEVRSWVWAHAAGIAQVDAIGGSAAVGAGALRDLALHANRP